MIRRCMERQWAGLGSYQSRFRLLDSWYFADGVKMLDLYDLGYRTTTTQLWWLVGPEVICGSQACLMKVIEE